MRTLNRVQSLNIENGNGVHHHHAVKQTNGILHSNKVSVCLSVYFFVYPFTWFHTSTVSKLFNQF